MKILILSASTGGGHMTASHALCSYIQENKLAEVKVVDTLEYISPILNKTVVEGYHYMALRAPKVFGVVYKTTNKDTPLSSLVFYLNSLFSKKLVSLVEEYQPDIIISTHPFPTEMISNLKEIGKVSLPLVCIITDYAPHKTWINKNVEGYVVANEEMVSQMEIMGVNKNLIHPFGIPVNDSFYKPSDRETTLEELGLDKNLKTILIMAGSMGATQIFDLYKRIANIDVNFQVIIITGNNKSLYKSFKKLLDGDDSKIADSIQKMKVKGFNKISSLKTDSKFLYIANKLNVPKLLIPKKIKPTKLIFFTNEVYKYMQAVDLIVTKPGGLTVSEALACNVPMALFNAIPGQEEENADFLIRNNMAVNLEKTSSISDKIKEILLSPMELESMKMSCENFDKSKSVKNILNLLSDLIEKE